MKIPKFQLIQEAPPGESPEVTKWLNLPLIRARVTELIFWVRCVSLVDMRMW